MICGNKAHFTPGVRAEKLGSNIKHFLAFCRTPRVANQLPKFYGTRFSHLGPVQGHKVQHLLVTWGRLKIFFCVSALTRSVKPLGLISTFPPIGMLDLSCTLALTPSIKWA